MYKIVSPCKRIYNFSKCFSDEHPKNYATSEEGISRPIQKCVHTLAGKNLSYTNASYILLISITHVAIKVRTFLMSYVLTN